MRLHELVRQHPLYGYSMITARLHPAEWCMNFKRIDRLWRRESFKMPRKFWKTGRSGHSGDSCVLQRARQMGHVRCRDFIRERTASGQSLKWLAITDESTRECLTWEVARSITTNRVLDILANLFVTRGGPGDIGSAHGPEAIAAAIRRHGATAGLEMLYIETCSPWENGCAASFFSRPRNELRNAEEFMNLTEDRWFVRRWPHDENEERPRSSLACNADGEFASQ